MNDGRRKAFKSLHKKMLGAALVMGLQNSVIAAPLDLSAWDVNHPESLRFGVVTQSTQQTYLSRLRQSMPLKPKIEVKTSNFAPAFKNPDFEISQLTHGFLNALGGRFGSFAKSPSYAESEMTSQGLSLGINHKPPGYAGLWIQLGRFTSQEHVFLDARKAKYLSFWVKGSGNYRLKLSDQKWFAKEDAQDLGPLDTYLYAGDVADTAPVNQAEVWRQVIVPLDTEKLPGRLDMSQLATLVVQADVPGKHILRLRDLHLHQQSPAHTLPADFSTQSLQEQPLRHSTWVWETKELLKTPNKWPALIKGLTAANVHTVFLQLPAADVLKTETDNSLLPGEVDFDTLNLPKLVAAFHAAGIEVHALDGDPRFALSGWHQGVLNTLSRLSKYQHEQPEKSRFDGIHYDIEPYLLPGFFGAKQKEIMGSYIQLAKAMHWRSQLMEIPLGFSLPFWLDMPDEFTAEPLEIEVDGLKQSLQAHLQSRSDYIALMDYKTRFWGQGGIYESALGELSFARAHKKKVYIGLETLDLPDESLYLFNGKPSASRPAGDALVIYALPNSSSSSSSLGDWQFHVLQAGQPLPDDAKQRGVQSLFWSLQPYAQVKSEQLSFSKKGAEPLKNVLKQTQDVLGSDPAFAGVALHHSTSLLQLMESGTP